MHSKRELQALGSQYETLSSVPFVGKSLWGVGEHTRLSLFLLSKKSDCTNMWYLM